MKIKTAGNFNALFAAMAPLRTAGTGVLFMLLLLLFVCPGVADAQTVHLNEIESNGGTPDDWFELTNTGATAVDISGWRMLDNDNTHVAYVFPAGTTIAPGAYLVVDTGGIGFSFGLGAPDSVRIYRPADSVSAPYETFSWTAHAATTYGRCPNGTGAFATSTTSTKGAANDCSGVAGNSPVRINEIESSGGSPGDWVELYNPGAVPANISGFVFRDNDGNAYTIPFGTSIPAGGFLVLDEATFGFGLGGADSARLFDNFGVLVDSYAWPAHAASTYGRCANGTGIFIPSLAITKGSANPCPAWPGGAAVQTADGSAVFHGNLSGLDYEGSGASSPGVLWAARNGPGSLFRLIFDGSIWTPDPANDWGSGKLLFYPGGGTASPDSEAVTFTGNSSEGLYVAVERDNNANAVSRNSILRFDPSEPGSTLTATHEWNLTADLPVTGPNLGAEAITWIPDMLLVASGFNDAGKSHLYNPDEYPNHGAGLFFVGLEANGNIYAYALDHSGTGAFTRIATISTGFPGVMDLQFDSLLGDLWAQCDDTCKGLSAILRIDGAGNFTVASVFQRPGPDAPNGMPNLNNEGFAMTPASECIGNLRPAFWADDSETGGHAIRTGSLSCLPVVNVVDLVPPKAFPTASPDPNGAGWNNSDVTVTWNWVDNLGGSGIDPANCAAATLSSGEGALTLNGTCNDLAGNTGNASYPVKVDKSVPTIAPSATNADSTPYTFGTWTNQTVTVHYTCTDAVSPIATCAEDQVFAVEGEFSTSGDAVDSAGNSASSGLVLVRIDKTLPAATATANPAAGANGWNNVNVVVQFGGADALSGIAFCTPAATLSGDGVGQSASGTCADHAGNVSAPATASNINIDKTAPVVVPPSNQTVDQMTPDGTVVAYPAPTVTDSLSGVASSGCLPPSGSVFPLGATTVTCTATDNAGNTTTAAFTITVTPAGRMYGAGFVGEGGQHHHFIFRVAQVRNGDKGSLEYWVEEARECRDDDESDHRIFNGDHDNGYGRDRHKPKGHFEATSFEAVEFSDDPGFKSGNARRPPTVDTVKARGKGRWNGRSGYTFEMTAADRGKPGRNRDTFSIIVKDARGITVAQVNGSLDGGNIQSTRLVRLER